MHLQGFDMRLQTTGSCVHKHDETAPYAVGSVVPIAGWP